MKLSWRSPRLLLSAIVAVGALAGLNVHAAPAYAAGPYVTATGGPGYVEVDVGGFNADATVRVEVLTANLSETLNTDYVQVNWIGYMDGELYLGTGGYSGKVWVAADGAPGPTAWASTQVSPCPCPWPF
jgi:hypothetical protein